MKLDLGERCLLTQILPVGTTNATMRILLDIDKMLNLTEQESKDWAIASDGTFKLDELPDTTKDFIFGEAARSVIVKQLNLMDREKKILRIHATIWDKFVDQIEAGEDIERDIEGDVDDK